MTSGITWDTGIRAYDRAFDWIYVLPPAPVVPPPPLVGIWWDGLDLDAGEADGMCLVVEEVDGWVGSAPLDGHDTVRAVADGSAWGPKTLGARVIAITGAAVGPRDRLAQFRDALVMRAGRRQPAPLVITDGMGDMRSLTASTRADTDRLSVKWLGRHAFRYQVTLTAADPLLYENTWQQVTLSPGGASVSGRAYPRTHSWAYSSADTPTSALLVNTGNAPAPVWLLYEGDLLAPVVRDDAGRSILLADVAAGMQLVVASDDLSAWAQGGVSRAWYVLPGSVPMFIPPQTSARWRVILAWRSAWT
jgi:hypothetical protein